MLRITALLFSLMLISACSIFQEPKNPRWNYEGLESHGFNLFLLDEASSFDVGSSNLQGSFLNGLRGGRKEYIFDLGSSKIDFESYCDFDYSDNDLGVALGDYPLFLIVALNKPEKSQTKESVYSEIDKNRERDKLGRKYISTYKVSSKVVVCDPVKKDVLYAGGVKTKVDKSNYYTEYCENKEHACKLISHFAQGRDFPDYPTDIELLSSHASDIAALLPRVPCKKIGFWECFKRGFE